MADTGALPLVSRVRWVARAGGVGPLFPYLGIALAGVVLWALLVTANAFYASVLAAIMIWTVATSGLNIIGGLGGYPSLVQGAFYGIGAYASTLAIAHGQTLLESIGVAIIASALVGLAIGIIFVRTRGQYFAIGTLFFGVVVTLVFNNWRGVTGGPLGMPVPLSFGTMSRLNLVLAISTAASLGIVYYILNSRLGERLVAIREDEDLAEHVGVPTTRVKLIAFVLSAVIGGFAGVLIAQYNGTISPGLFNYYVGFVMFVALSVGGAGRVLGPLFGCAFIVGVPQLLNLPSGTGQLLVGAVFVVVVLIVPGGFMSVPAEVYRIIGHRERSAAR